MIKSIFWDVDGTLLDFLSAEASGIRSCFKKYGLGECDDEMMRIYSGINVQYWQKLERGELTKERMLHERFEVFFDMYGLDKACIPEFNNEYQYRLCDTICFNEGAMETLKTLKSMGIMQCAATNGTKITQDRKLVKAGLSELFDKIFISEVVGYAKPLPEFYDYIFETLGNIKREEVLMVGDSLTSDIRGGVNAGIKTCWFNPKKGQNDKSFKPDFEIEKLADVVEIVKNYAK